MENKELLENTSGKLENAENVQREATLADLIGGEDDAFNAKFATQGEEKPENESETESTPAPKKRRTFKQWLFSIIPTKRRIVQLYSALLFNANLKGYVQGNMFVGNTKFICSPGINCYSCPGAIGTCPLGALQNELGNRHLPFYILGILFLYGLMLGRAICGWLCPFGLFQDLIYKIKTPKLKKSGVTRVLSYLKYVILAVFVFILAGFGIFPAFCKYICPAGILEGAFGILPQNGGMYLSGIGQLFTWKFVLFVTIVVFCIFAYRAFCRFICPLGAIYSLFNRFSFFGIKLNRDACTKCGKCVSKCKMDIKHVGDQECISCGECIDVCPTKAISFKGPKIFLAPNEIKVPKDLDDEEREKFIEQKEAENAKIKKKNRVRKIVIGSVMGALLLSVLFYFNVIKNDKLWDFVGSIISTDTSTDTGSDTNSNGPAVGTAIGNKLPSASLEIFDENGLSGEFVDPTVGSSGKVTVINFWGTWCPSCVKELPHFNEVAEEYSDSVVIYAVHTVTNFNVPINADYGTAPEFVGKYHNDSSLIFLKDTGPGGDTLDDYFTLTTGGKLTLYPWTIILDEDGIITFTSFGELTKDKLISEIEKAMNN